MEGRERTGRWGREVSIAAAVLALGPGLAAARDDAPNVRLIHNAERFAVVRALGGAARALGHPECQALLDEFADGFGRPLRSALQVWGGPPRNTSAGSSSTIHPRLSAGVPRWP